MSAEQILNEINECIYNADLDGVEDNIDILTELLPDEEASKELSMLLFQNYTSFKAGSLAKMMEVIIRKRPQLALLKHPENFLFRVAIIKGSFELYECYIEEAVEPFLANQDADEQEIYYGDLMSITESLTEAFFPQYETCKKGLHYNGAFATAEDNPNVLLINRDNYEVMEEVMEKYNTIIGRRDIIQDLNKRAGLIE
ncbi:hypothetical protein [Labilibaculum antarcticum]|uniref:Uncharacterized protein n=1 Tax=Labilibaculum antarcticum TaxID=1717717 RepID=A0A1Y1CKK2_9BACT|nr:hypothetical protein [Labilibaculum antarcticum]BAX80834.1 hypothetical protein ALGA_2512 [Labilibaculum antarcticum]